MPCLSSKLLDGVFQRLEDLLLASDRAGHSPVAVAANLSQVSWLNGRDGAVGMGVITPGNGITTLVKGVTAQGKGVTAVGKGVIA